MKMDRKEYNNKELSLLNTSCALCEKKNISSNSNYNINTRNISQNYHDLYIKLKKIDSNFHFNKYEISNLLINNSINGGEVISPCSCEKKYHKNCILLYLLYSSKIYCENCLEIYNIISIEQNSIWKYLFIKHENFLPLLFYLLICILSSLGIYLITTSDISQPDIYKETKIFFLIILIIIDSSFIIAIIIKSIELKKKQLPFSIYIEEKTNTYQIDDQSNINKINNYQNSHQYMITYNNNYIKYLKNQSKNKSDLKSLSSKVINNGVNIMHYNSIKNFIDYNEYFLNIFCIEIFEAKMNFLNRNKLLSKKNNENFNILRELNDEEFQQFILMKYMDFNSSSDSSEEGLFKNKITQILKHNKNVKSNQAINNKSFKNAARKFSNETPISIEHSDVDSENEKYYKKLNGMIPDSSKENNKIINKKKVTIEDDNNIYLKSCNIKDNGPDYFDNNEKLILKENKVRGSLKRGSNSNLYNLNNNSGKLKLNNSSKELTSYNNSLGNSKYNKIENEGFDYRDFIVTEQKEFSKNNSKHIKPKSKLSQDKIPLKRKDSKITSALFGEFHDIRAKSIGKSNWENNAVNSSSKNNSDMCNNSSNNSLSKNKKTRKSENMYHKFSNFNPEKVQHVNSFPGAFSNNENMGMNIFCRNVINNYKIDKNHLKSQNNYGTSALSKLSKSNTNNSIRQNKKLNNTQFENRSIIHNKKSAKFNFGTEENSNNISKYSYRNREQKLLTISPGELKKKLSERVKKSFILKNSTNYELDLTESEYINHKLEELRRNTMSNSQVGVSRNLINKLVHDNSSSFESFSNDISNLGIRDNSLTIIINANQNSHLSKINTSINNSLINNNNYMGIKPSQNISTDTNLKKRTFLKDTLNTINEDNEIPLKSSKINQVLNENNSEFNDENIEKRTIFSDDLNKFVDHSKENSLNNTPKNLEIINGLNNNNENQINKNLGEIKNKLIDNVKDIIEEKNSDSYLDSSYFSDVSDSESIYNNNKNEKNNEKKIIGRKNISKDKKFQNNNTILIHNTADIVDSKDQINIHRNKDNEELLQMNNNKNRNNLENLNNSEKTKKDNRHQNIDKRSNEELKEQNYNQFDNSIGI